MPSIKSKMNGECYQPDQKLDRTTLYGALYIIYEYRVNPQRMVFLLIALVYGFTPRKTLFTSVVANLSVEKHFYRVWLYSLDDFIYHLDYEFSYFSLIICKC